MGRAWGCTPAQLRQCTFAELAAMIDLLNQEDQQRRKKG